MLNEKSGRPVFTVRSKGIEVSVWENQGKESVFCSTSIKKSYLDEGGVWKSSSSFSVQDLGVLAVLLGKAQEFVLLDHKVAPVVGDVVEEVV